MRTDADRSRVIRIRSQTTSAACWLPCLKTMALAFKGVRTPAFSPRYCVYFSGGVISVTATPACMAGAFLGTGDPAHPISAVLRKKNRKTETAVEVSVCIGPVGCVATLGSSAITAHLLLYSHFMFALLKVCDYNMEGVVVSVFAPYITDVPPVAKEHRAPLVKRRSGLETRSMIRFTHQPEGLEMFC